jgi:hypothetical protein
MRLYELCSQIVIQGNIELAVFDEEGNEKERRFYRDQFDFDTNCTDAFDLEDLEVTYMFPNKGCDGSAWLVIELRESHEV